MKKLILLLSLPFFLSCQQEEIEQAPQTLVPEDTMTLVLMGLHVEQAKISFHGLAADTSQKLYKLKENQVFADFNISKERFEESYKYYLKDAEKIDNIYGRVVDSLALKEQRANSKAGH